MSDKHNYDYVPAFFFQVDFAGLGEGSINVCFQEVSGIQAEMVIEEVEEGGVNGYIHKLPKRTRFPNLVLKRALSATPSEINKWVEDAIFNYEFQLCRVSVLLVKVIEGEPVKEDIETKKSREYEVVRSWKFTGVYPVKIEWSTLNAQKSELVIETLELAYRNATCSEENIG